MRIADYIVQFLIEKGVTDVWGYPGGSVTSFIDALKKKQDKISSHVVYHEQAAGFAACSYYNKNGIPGIAYSTGGPGATNLLTALGHAYYDSISVIYITGNVNTHEAKGDLKIRQKGFQESDIISVSKPLTKCSIYVEEPEKIRYYLEKAYYYAMSGRPGPVWIDVPMNMFRMEVDEDNLSGFNEGNEENNAYEVDELISCLRQELEKASAPVFLLGNALKKAQLKDKVIELIEHYKIPYVTSMISFDVAGKNEYNYGFIGAYGDRAANIIVSKCDLLISLGNRLDQRQTGAIRENFASNAQIVRVDIDEGELSYRVHEDEKSFCMDVEVALDVLLSIKSKKEYKSWTQKCGIIKAKLAGMDTSLPTDFIYEISRFIPPNSVVTTDVGQNMVWVPQAFSVKEGQKFMFSGGMGAMGHSLPAAIGACYPRDNAIVCCVCGDGGLQMNIQELQYIVRDQLPIKIIVVNNYSLGMIRYFQEMYFDGDYAQTTLEGGYSVPDFVKIAEAYGIRGRTITELNQVETLKDELNDSMPLLVNIQISEDTYTLPKLEYGKPNYDQQPLMDRKLLAELMDL